MAAKLETVNILPARYRIASIIRKAILAGEYKEGETLSLTLTAEQLGVSRTPVREAFQMLASEELIELRLNKEAIVKGISVDMIRDHFDVRIILEGEAVSRAALSRMDVSGLLLRQAQIEEKKDGFSPDEFREYNQLFHTSIWKAAGNKKMYSMLTSLWNGSSFGKTVTEQEHNMISVDEHRAILDDIIKGDPYMARKDMENHLNRSMKNIIDSYNLELT